MNKADLLKKASVEKALNADSSKDIVDMLNELDQHIERINNRISKEVNADIRLRSVQAFDCANGKKKFCMDVNGKQFCWCV